MSDELTHYALRQPFDTASGRHFSLFLRRVMATVSPGVRFASNWHLEAIAAYLEACERREINRLIINLPPRMLKSTLVSVAWPAWLLGHQPAERIMAASYAQGLSLKHSTDCRAVLAAEWYARVFPETRLAEDQNEKAKFATTQRGFRRAVSVGGAAIGEGGNVLIIDDPINPLQAGYRIQREAVNQWFAHTWASRLDDKQRGVMVVVMQRLHPEDLSGYLLAQGGWELLSLPAIAPVQQVIRCGSFAHVREAGALLHPAREPQAVLERTKRELGSANFSAQYQQAPVRTSGGVVRREWLQRLAAPAVEAGLLVEDPAHEWREAGAEIIQSWDTGIKAGAQHDASACATFALKAGMHHLIDMQVVRQEYPALKRTIEAQAARYRPSAILLEDKGSGQSLLQDLRREGSLPLIGIQPSGDKLSRLLRVTPVMEARQFAVPEHAPWLAALEEELLNFPDSAHDDQVDAITQYLNWIRTRRPMEGMQVRRV